MTTKKPIPTPPPGASQTDKSTAKSRRKVLKAAGAVATTGAFLDHWKKPVTSSALLPAHATGSPGAPTPPTPPAPTSPTPPTPTPPTPTPPTPTPPTPAP